jgi:hypothetical protein
MFNKIFNKLSNRFFPVTTYTVVLADYECILPELAQIISADYMPGSYDIFEEKFHQSGKSTSEWFLTGEFGQLIVYFEEYEGYYCSSFKAPNPQFQMGEKLLQEAYVAQRGNQKNDNVLLELIHLK